MSKWVKEWAKAAVCLGVAVLSDEHTTLSIGWGFLAGVYSTEGLNAFLDWKFRAEGDRCH